MARIALYDDAQALNLRPLTWLRPVFELRCGHFTPRERLQALAPTADWGAWVRPGLAETYREEQPRAHVNDVHWLCAAPTLLIDGRWIGDPRRLLLLGERDVAVCQGVPMALWLHPDEADLLASDAGDGWMERLARDRRPAPAEGRIAAFPWDLVAANGQQIALDFQQRRRGPSKANLGAQSAVLGRDDDVYIDPTAQVDPFVVLDARHGPVWVDAGAVLQPFTRLEGPCYVGRESQLFRANVREGTSIGPVCRVGGEIEESIIHGCANKYHDGFLGHSYVCPWVNLGALSTNSDLKNDYSHVRVPLWGEPLDSGSSKVGCFLGDHTKAALCSLFNTGTSVGVMSMVLPAGELLPKHIPSFTRLWHGVLEDLPGPGAMLSTARTAMSRRNCTLTPAMERLLQQVFEATRDERRLARDRAAGRRGGSSPFPPQKLQC